MLRFLFCTIISLCSLLCNAQQNQKAIIDSLKQLDTDDQIIYLHYSFGNNSLLLEDSIQLKSTIKKLKDIPWKSQKLVQQIHYFELIAPTIIEKNLDQRIQLFAQILQDTDFENPNYPVLLHQIGMSYYNNKQHAKGIEYLIKAKNKFSEIGYERYPEAGVYLHDLALVYHTFKQYEECISLMHKALATKPFSPNLSIQRYNTLSSAYAHLKHTDSTIHYNKATYNEAKRHNDSLWMIISSLNISEETNENSDTFLLNNIHNIDNWIRNKNLENDVEIAFLYNKVKLSHLKIEIKRKNISAAENILKGITLHPHSLPKQQLFQSHIRDHAYLKMYYETLKDYNLAKQNYQKALLYSDSANVIKKEIEHSYNKLVLDVANDQLSISQRNYAIDKLELKRKNNILIFSTITILLCAILILIQYKKSKKEKLSIALQLQKDQLQYKVDLQSKELELAQQHIKLSINKLTEKNEIIDKIQAELEKLQLQKQPFSGELSPLEHELAQLKETRILTEDDWIEFQKNYATINKEMFDHLRNITPKLTEAEIRYLMLISLELTNKDIANILGISPDSLRVTWNRIKKKYTAENFENAKQMLQNIKALINN